jgi:hypothetical protein
MPSFSFERPQVYEDVNITVYQDAIDPQLCRDIVAVSTAMFADSLREVTKPGNNVRRFAASPVMPIGTIPELDMAITDAFGNRFSTMRFNLQGPKGKQGWHQDYILEPVVLYPYGEGCIDLKPDAINIRQARENRGLDVITVPVGAGDIAVLGSGGELFHRGRNASAVGARQSVVLH